MIVTIIMTMTIIIMIIDLTKCAKFVCFSVQVCDQPESERLESCENKHHHYYPHLHHQSISLQFTIISHIRYKITDRQITIIIIIINIFTIVIIIIILTIDFDTFCAAIFIFTIIFVAIE